MWWGSNQPVKERKVNSAVKYSAVKYSAVKYSAVKYSSVSSSLQCRAVKFSGVEYHEEKCIAVQCRDGQRTVQHSVIQLRKITYIYKWSEEGDMGQWAGGGGG